MPGAAPYGSQGADIDFLLDRLLIFDPSRLFLGAGGAEEQTGSSLSLISPPSTRHSSLATSHFLGSSASHQLQ